MTLQWYKDDMPIISSAKFMINKVDSKMSFLILRDVGLDHTGTYTCLAFNPVGQQKFSAQLWVNGNDDECNVLHVVVSEYVHSFVQKSMTFS